MPPVKKLPAIFLLVMLLLSLCTVLTVFATDSTPFSVLSLHTGKDYITATPSEILPDKVVTGEELLDWMDQHAASGGSVALAADLTISEAINWAQPYRAKPMVIELGAYSINVTGELAWLGASLTIRADGSENSRVVVAEGGWLSLDVILEGGSEPAVWQNEGSVLYTQYIVAQPELIHYARMPVIDCLHEKPLLTTVKAGDTVAESLPASIEVKVSKDGIASWEEREVSWHLNEEEAETLDKRIRTSINVTFTDLDAVGSLTCVIVFHDQPVTFLQVEAIENRMMRKIFMNFTLPDEETIVMVQYSFDGENWITDNSAIDIPGTAVLSFLMPEYADDEDLIWDVEADSRLHVRIHIPDAEHEADAYSDVIVVSGENMKIQGEIGGNRGGGTEIPGPPPIPPEQPTLEQPTLEQPAPEQPAPEQPAPKQPTGSLSTAEQSSETNKTSERLPEVQPIPEPSSGSVLMQNLPDHRSERSEWQLPSLQEHIAREPEPSSGRSEAPRQYSMEPSLSSQPEIGDNTLERTIPPLSDMDHTPAEAALAKAIPIIVGSTVTVVLVGGAGIYHSTLLRRRFLNAIKALLRLIK